MAAKKKSAKKHCARGRGGGGEGGYKEGAPIKKWGQFLFFILNTLCKG